MKFREAESHTQHEAALSCKEVTSSLHSKPEGFCLDEQISETAHGSLSVEQFLLYTWGTVMRLPHLEKTTCLIPMGSRPIIPLFTSSPQAQPKRGKIPRVRYEILVQ